MSDLPFFFPSDEKSQISSLDELFRRSKDFRSNAKFIEAIEFVARFRKYSPYNNLLVYLQNPRVTFYATAKHWNKAFQRRIKPDSRPMVILAPMTPVLLVYDTADTEGRPLPDYFEKAFETKGQIPDRVFDLTVENAKQDGLKVKNVNLSFLHGGSAIRQYDIDMHEGRVRPDFSIELNSSFSKEQRYSILCHELAHIYLGHLGAWIDSTWPDRSESLNYNQKELEAEAASFLVCKRRGIETRSAEYLAGYFKSEKDVDFLSIDLIVKIASHVERMGNKSLPKRKPRNR